MVQQGDKKEEMRNQIKMLQQGNKEDKIRDWKWCKRRTLKHWVT